MTRYTFYLMIICAVFCFFVTPTYSQYTNEQAIISVPFQTKDKHLIVHGEGNIRSKIHSKSIKLVSGIKGSAIAFDGVKDQEVRIYSKPMGKLREELTISIWVKPTAFNRKTQTVISRGWNWELRLKSNGAVHITFLGKPYRKHRSKLKSQETIPSAKWTNICYTFSLSKHQCALFINGKQVDENRNVDFKLRDEGSSPLLVGMDPSNYNPYYGAVDELKVFDRALSSSEVAQLYAQEGKDMFRRTAVKWSGKLQKKRKLILNSNNAGLKKKYKSAMQIVDNLKQQGAPDKYWEAKSKIDELNSSLYIYQLHSKIGNQGLTKSALFVVNPFSGKAILPKTQISLSKLSNTLKVQGVPSELLTASFVLKPILASAKKLDVKATNLKSIDNNDVIPSSTIDIRAVKTWYQGETAWNSPSFDAKKNAKQLNPVLVPELLLHNSSLVKVNYKKKQNYLKLNGADGERYVDISKRNMRKLPGYKYQYNKKRMVRVSNPVSAFPVADDARILQPLHVAKGNNQQFWVTIKIPKDAKPGQYKGKLKITSSSGVAGALTLQVRILPFHLSHPVTHYNIKKRFYTSVYYRGKLSNNGKAYIGSEIKSKEQYKAELRDLHKHGMDFVANRVSLDKPRELREVMKIQRKIVGGTTLYYTGTSRNLGIGIKNNDKALATLARRASKLKSIARSLGYKHVYIYGIDEARGARAMKEKRIWQRLHKMDIKVYVAGKRRLYKKLGKVLDILVSAGSVSRKPAKYMHKHGNRIYSYSNPQSGPENPKLFRVNYGIKLWKHNYDGAMTYAYQSAFGTVWDDFDSHISNYRNENFTYPTTHGVIDTIAWEGYALAKRDVKYVSKLWQLIHKNQDSSDSTKKKVAKEAKNYIENLNIGLNTNLKKIRSTIINYILKLHR